jgi:hypothetical protein
MSIVINISRSWRGMAPSDDPPIPAHVLIQTAPSCRVRAAHALFGLAIVT